MSKRFLVSILICVLLLCGCIAPPQSDLLTSEDEARILALPETFPMEMPFLLVGADETERRFSCWLKGGGEADLILFSEDGARQISAEVIKDDESGVFLNALLDELVPGCTYQYCLTDGSSRTQIADFDIEDTSEGFQFLFASDSQLQIPSKNVLSAAWRHSVELGLLEAPDAAFLLSGGDQVNDPDLMDEYRWFNPDGLFASLALAPCRGNHEEDCNIYPCFFSTPNAAGETGYFFSYGNTLIVVLNTNLKDYDAYGALIHEANKAYQEANRSNPAFLIVDQHHPMFSNGDYSLHVDTIARQETLAPIYSKENVDLVLMGHEHQYSRSHLMHGTEISSAADSGANTLYPNVGDTLYVTASTASGVKYYEPDNDDFHKHTAVSLQMNEPEITVVTIRDQSLTVETFTTMEAFYPIDTVTLIKSNKE